MFDSLHGGLKLSPLQPREGTHSSPLRRHDCSPQSSLNQDKSWFSAGLIVVARLVVVVVVWWLVLLCPALTSGQFQQPHLQSVFSDFLLCFFPSNSRTYNRPRESLVGTNTNTQEAPSVQPGPLPSVSNCKYSVVVQFN